MMHVMHDLQCLNAGITPGCYRRAPLRFARTPPWACTRTSLSRRAQPLLPYHRLHWGVQMLCTAVAHTRRRGKASAIDQLRRHHVAAFRRLCCRHTPCPHLNHVHVDDHVSFYPSSCLFWTWMRSLKYIREPNVRFRSLRTQTKSAQYFKDRSYNLLIGKLLV